MFLHDIGMSEEGFLTTERQTALRRQLVDSISGDVTLPQAWLAAINQFQNQQRSIQYVALGPAQAGDIPQPTDEELSKYFDERKILFRAPEYRKIDTVTVTPAALAQWMQISDDDIKTAYDEQHASFVTPEKRHIEQIVFPQLADAQAAADRIKSGTGFADIATERGLKPQDIDLGTVAKASMVDPKVADVAFSLKEGEVSAPIQTQFGVGAGQRAQDRAADDKIARRRHAAVAQPDRARSRQETARRTCTTKSKTIAPAAARSKRRRKRKSCRSSLSTWTAPGAIRTASSPLTCRTAPTSSAPRSPPTSASTTIRSTSTAAISGTTSPPSRRRATALSTRSKAR